MVKTGSQLKLSKTVRLEDQRLTHIKWMELGNIINDFSDAMHNANYEYIASHHRQTLNMESAWMRYIDWCQRNYGKKG